MYDNSGDSARRLSFSFIVVLFLHGALLWMLNVSSVTRQERSKIITNVELQHYAAPVLKTPSSAVTPSFAVAPPAPAAGKAAGAFALPVQRPAERQVAIIDQLPAQAQRQTRAAADRLVDRAEPLSAASRTKMDGFGTRSNTRSGGGLADVAETVSRSSRQPIGGGMQALTDRQAPLRRASADGATALPEIGRERAAQTVADVAPATVQPAARPALADKSRLLERKEAMRRQLAGLRDESLPARSTQQIGDIEGAPRSRSLDKDTLAQVSDSAVSAPSQGRSSGGTARMQTAAVSAIRDSGAGQGPAGDTAAVERKQRSAPDLPGIMKKTAAAPAVAEIRQSPVKISGPLEKRKVLSASVPPYPDWAKRRGIEADVSLKFFVTPAGRVTDDVAVLTTSGYIELDVLCIEHIKKWTFAPLSVQEEQQKQWGIITMRFRLE